MIKVVKMRQMVVILSDRESAIRSLQFRKNYELVNDILEIIDTLQTQPTRVLSKALRKGLNLSQGDVLLRYQYGIVNLMIHGQAIPIAWDDLESLYDKLLGLYAETVTITRKKDVLVKPSAKEKAREKAREKAEREVPRAIAEDPVALSNLKDEGGPPAIIHSMLVDLIEGHGTHRTLLITPETMAQIKRDAGVRMITKRTRLCLNALLWERELCLVHKSGRYFLGRKDSVENMSPDTAVNPV